jgi:hypothetical protein
MIPFTKSSEYLNQMATGESRVRIKWGDREKEKEISGLSE